jgi:hypothetical protein
MNMHVLMITHVQERMNFCVDLFACVRVCARARARICMDLEDLVSDVKHLRQMRRTPRIYIVHMLT